MVKALKEVDVYKLWKIVSIVYFVLFLIVVLIIPVISYLSFYGVIGFGFIILFLSPQKLALLYICTYDTYDYIGNFGFIFFLY